MAIVNNSAILKSISHDEIVKKFFIKMVSCLCPSSGRLDCSKKKEIDSFRFARGNWLGINS